MPKHRKRGVWAILRDAGVVLIVFMLMALAALALGVGIGTRMVTF
jgi:hypothetical protein